jgi:hypothetical protein
MKVECTSGTGVGGDMALDLLLGEGILGRLDQPGAGVVLRPQSLL